jgi:hypothetical protein
MERCAVAVDEAEGYGTTGSSRRTPLSHLVGERSHTYRFRARAWQSTPTGTSCSYRPLGDSVTTSRRPDVGWARS